jgi:ubiquinone/menaquinone biosynthesis C-methylase UbiE
MKRTPEPELMLDADQVTAYAGADFSTSDAAFVEACLIWFSDCGLTPRRVLDLGCGPGNIALRLAASLPDAEITGLDGSRPMLEVARLRSTSSKLRWIEATLPDTPLKDGHFDAIVCNSLLHHLHDPQILWRTIIRLARPGSPFLVGDLRRPSSPEEALALTTEHAAGAPEVLKRDFHASLHAAFTPGEVEGQLAEAGLRSAKLFIPSDRHLRVLGRTPP